MLPSKSFQAVVAVATAMALCWWAVPAATAAPTATAAEKDCGSFKHHYTYDVSRSGKITCKFAMRIVRSFIKNHKSWTKHSVDNTLAGTYYTNRKFRGWRCSEGSGGGGCSRPSNRNTVAGYQSRPG